MGVHRGERHGVQRPHPGPYRCRQPLDEQSESFLWLILWPAVPRRYAPQAAGTRGSGHAPIQMVVIALMYRLDHKLDPRAALLCR